MPDAVDGDGAAIGEGGQVLAHQPIAAGQARVEGQHDDAAGDATELAQDSLDVVQWCTVRTARAASAA